MKRRVEKILSNEAADTFGKVWGIGSDNTKDPSPWEGGLRIMCNPTLIDSLWIHGGNLHQSPRYSRDMALQLRTRYEGMDTPAHKLPEVHQKEWPGFGAGSPPSGLLR